MVKKFKEKENDISSWEDKISNIKKGDEIIASQMVDKGGFFGFYKTNINIFQ